MKISKKFLFVSSLFFNLFQSLYGVQYKAKPLDVLPILSEEAQTLSFSYKIFNKADCKKFLGREQIIKNGYHPIQISITNNTSKYFTFSLINFSFPCLSFEEVAESVHFNAIHRALAWGIGGLFVPLLWIPAVVEYIQSPEANALLDSDYERKALNNQIIKPFTTINGLVFATNNFTNFFFSLNDSNSNKRVTLSTKSPVIHLTNQNLLNQ